MPPSKRRERITVCNKWTGCEAFCKVAVDGVTFGFESSNGHHSRYWGQISLFKNLTDIQPVILPKTGLSLGKTAV
ncbi:hypothetical protein J42TS3_41380 [Paenibacillus vini]|uniref:Uncharacterized protein n=1 Tax=Paenibacillus vini TaxID=1476024 RepID=A0ABQ4MGM1_9BACL|nr:hypothetical protein J42TS3_41380 [Paenibacillus vini]